MWKLNNITMNKFTKGMFVGALALIVFQSFDTKSLRKVDGTEPGYTGSPGDSLKNCTVCHGGTAVAIEGWITSNIPTTGFVPGNTYKITATNTSLSHNRFGFSISPQAINGTLLGKLIVTDTARTKLNGNDKYITYRPAGVPNDDKAIWEFEWVAPADTVNEVVFYGAFNSNQDGHKGGDLTRLSTLKVFKEGFTGGAELSFGLNQRLYPNPCNDYLEISMDIPVSSETTISLCDLNGKVVETLFQNFVKVGTINEKINMTHVKSGVYLVQTETGKLISRKKILVIH
jgi:hypothetical protein